MGSDGSLTNPKTPDSQKTELLSGLLFSISRLANAISPHSIDSEFKSFATSTYKCHFFKSPTGLIFSCMTHQLSADYKSLLLDFYTNVYIPEIMNNPLQNPRQPIIDQTFNKACSSFLESSLRSSPIL